MDPTTSTATPEQENNLTTEGAVSTFTAINKIQTNFNTSAQDNVVLVRIALASGESVTALSIGVAS